MISTLPDAILSHVFKTQGKKILDLQIEIVLCLIIVELIFKTCRKQINTKFYVKIGILAFINFFRNAQS